MNGFHETATAARHTRILPVDASKLGALSHVKGRDGLLDDFDIATNEDEEGLRHLRLAAERLRTSDVPVAFPTETVYGLGADATRSEAVRGIYAAKQRPSDNPLIVHFASLRQLKDLLASGQADRTNGQADDLIPPIYLPLIKRFWPGPLTIILPNTQNSPLAPEVTAGLGTFGARMPRDLLALLLIKLSGKPIAAPSANASTKPSPTAAEHVLEDLDGRIEYIIDGGPCDVGVESTVVDGLSNPPAVLRPGGISINHLRECPGWENVVVGYEDVSLKKGAPRAPGMKYRHYSPKAKVFLFDAGAEHPGFETLERQGFRTVGVVRTRRWKHQHADNTDGLRHVANGLPDRAPPHHTTNGADTLDPVVIPAPRPDLVRSAVDTPGGVVTCWDVHLGRETADVARNLFWALRELDRKGCDVICVEGIGSDEGDVAAAVMNRLRKAAEVQVEG